jgi:hypothetical protein
MPVAVCKYCSKFQRKKVVAGVGFEPMTILSSVQYVKLQSKLHFILGLLKSHYPHVFTGISA